MAAYNLIKTVSTGDTITAVDRNNEHQNHINNNTVAGVTGDSSNVAGMQATVDPYPASVESLASTLQGELERLRYVLTKIHGGAQWYVYPATNALLKGGGTMSGAIAMGTNKITGLGNGTAAQDAAAFGQLKVLQTITATYATSTATTSTTLADTGLTVSITPTSASNRILVLVMIPVGTTGTSGQIPAIHLQLQRAGSSVLDYPLIDALDTPSTTTMYTSQTMMFVDSPATTSATIYKVQYARAVAAAGGTVTVQHQSHTSVIIVMEVV